MNREIHGKKVVNAFRSCSKADEDGVYNWPQHGLKYGRGSEKLAAHTQQKMTHVPPVEVVNVITVLNVIKS